MSLASWVGQSLGGRYRIDALLGQGGMSAVYKATDPNLQRPVAIKMIHPHLSGDPEFVRRFQVEATAVARLRHPSIVQVYDFDHEGEVYYMVLEFIAGETLHNRLQALNATGQRMPIGQVVEVGVSLSDAVAYAHDEGLIHRDIKPANVMLTPRGHAILADFGIARIVGGQHHTATGAVIGTAKYMSPEAIRGQRVDHRADIYSLGVLLFEIASGRPPFDADSAMTIMMMHLNDPVPDLRQLNPAVPEELVAIIGRSLAKDPRDRYQSAGEMADALRRMYAAEAEIRRTGPLPEPTVIEALGGPTAAVGETLVEPSAREAAWEATAKPAARKPIASRRAGLGVGAAAVLGLILLVGGGYVAYARFLAPGAQPPTEPALVAVLPTASHRAPPTSKAAAQPTRPITPSPRPSPTATLPVDQANSTISSTSFAAVCGGRATREPLLFAHSFSPASSEIAAIDVRLRVYGSSSGEVALKIVSGSDTGPVVATDTTRLIAVPSLGAEKGTWVRFSFSPPVPVVPEAVYVISIEWLYPQTTGLSFEWMLSDGPYPRGQPINLCGRDILREFGGDLGQDWAFVTYASADPLTADQQNIVPTDDERIACPGRESLFQTFILRRGPLAAVDLMLDPIATGDQSATVRVREGSHEGPLIGAKTVPITIQQLERLWVRFELGLAVRPESPYVIELFDSPFKWLLSFGDAYRDGHMITCDGSAPPGHDFVFRTYAPPIP